MTVVCMGADVAYVCRRVSALIRHQWDAHPLRLSMSSS